MTYEHVAIELHAQDGARSLATSVGSLYDQVFSLPPFFGTDDESRNQRSYYSEILLRPGFQLAIARDHDRYIGFAYGYLLPSDTKWWNGLSEEVDQEFTRETGSRTFAIIDFGVLPAYRGIGVGKELHDSILSVSGAERATLTVQPIATETQAIYKRWGWLNMGQKPGSLGGAPIIFDVYVLVIAC